MSLDDLIEEIVEIVPVSDRDSVRKSLVSLRQKYELAGVSEGVLKELFGAVRIFSEENGVKGFDKVIEAFDREDIVDFLTEGIEFYILLGGKHFQKSGVGGLVGGVVRAAENDGLDYFVSCFRSDKVGGLLGEMDAKDFSRSFLSSSDDPLMFNLFGALGLLAAYKDKTKLFDRVIDLFGKSVDAPKDVEKSLFGAIKRVAEENINMLDLIVGLFENYTTSSEDIKDISNIVQESLFDAVKDVAKCDAGELSDFVDVFGRDDVFDLFKKYVGASEIVQRELFNSIRYIVGKNSDSLNVLVNAFNRNDIFSLLTENIWFDDDDNFFFGDYVKRLGVGGLVGGVVRAAENDGLDYFVSCFKRDEIKDLLIWLRSKDLDDSAFFSLFYNLGMAASYKDKPELFDDVINFFNGLVDYSGVGGLFEVFKDLDGEYLGSVVSCLREYNNKDGYVNIVEFYSLHAKHLNPELLDASIETKVEVSKVFSQLRNKFKGVNQDKYDEVRGILYYVVNKKYALNGEVGVNASLERISGVLIDGFDNYNDNSLRYVA
ncbi:hypothetical protein DRJ25_01015 [Candidatus Woesearchaeota archaeon]|nr:MAG: hypothetical protein DRJ25_01015 [Candidatus Woesearchaeota archaeon]